eukprot:954219-Amphidinium_carterae.1
MDEFEKIQGALEILGFSISKREDQNVKWHVMTDKSGPTWASVERRVVFNKDDGSLISKSAVQEDPECWHASLPSGIGDLEKTLDYLLDPIVGSPSRHKKVCGYVVMHVDDLVIAGSTVFLDWLIAELKKEYEIGSLEWDDDVAIEELNEGLIPKNVPDGERLNPEFHTEYRSVLGKLNWLQSRTQFHISYAFSRLASARAAPTVKDMKELNKAVRL